MVFLKRSRWIKSGANKAAVDEINANSEILMVVRQVKYLNNIVEQDHRAVASDKTNARIQIFSIS